MITVTDLLARGYRWYSPALCSVMHATSFYQKRVVDASGATRYFIDLFYYAATPYEPHERWQPTVELTFDAAHRQQVQLILMGYETVAEIEAFAATAYEQLGAVPWEDV